MYVTGGVKFVVDIFKWRLNVLHDDSDFVAIPAVNESRSVCNSKFSFCRLTTPWLYKYSISLWDCRLNTCWYNNCFTWRDCIFIWRIYIHPSIRIVGISWNIGSFGKFAGYTNNSIHCTNNFIELVTNHDVDFFEEIFFGFT